MYVSVLFSEPKIPQTVSKDGQSAAEVGFSALQRAENSSNVVGRTPHRRPARFSALQRAENSSKKRWRAACGRWRGVSVLFSEPKIPQIRRVRRQRCNRLAVSVLFSEPKIPQRPRNKRLRGRIQVSVLFSEPKIPQSFQSALQIADTPRFQCSSASRKFLKPSEPVKPRPATDVSVLFSEPKIPQTRSIDRTLDR